MLISSRTYLKLYTFLSILLLIVALTPYTRCYIFSITKGEESFSENFTVFIYFLTTLYCVFSHHKNKFHYIIAIISLIFLLEEFNYGLNFFGGTRSLNEDQFGIHNFYELETLLGAYDFTESKFFNFLFSFYFYVSNKIKINTYKIIITTPLLFLFILELSSFQFLGCGHSAEYIEELHEIFLAGNFLNFSILTLDKR